MLEAEDPAAIAAIQEGLKAKEAEGKQEFSMDDHEDFVKRRTAIFKEKSWSVMGFLAAAIGGGLAANELFGFIPLKQIGINLSSAEIANLYHMLTLGGATMVSIGIKLRNRREAAEAKKKAEVTNG